MVAGAYHYYFSPPGCVNCHDRRVGAGTFHIHIVLENWYTLTGNDLLSNFKMLSHQMFARLVPAGQCGPDE